ncbi:t-SNARE [Phellopilus nigrolimitatus]|nr:t-SNARE [Phellopilus nigrolimitatus]
MSFQDIETGLAQPPRSPLSSVPQSREEAAFTSLQSSLSLQVFKINANVQGILKLVDQLGTNRDYWLCPLGPLSDDTTRDMAKRGSEDLKKLAALQSTLPSQKTALQKVSHDFQLSLVAFQRAQQVSAERQRSVVQGVKIAVDDEQTAGPIHHALTATSSSEIQPGSSPQQRQALVLQQTKTKVSFTIPRITLLRQLSPHELAHQESLIEEREAEILEIEGGIHELSEIFRDLGTLVSEQGGMLDNIESNITSIAVDTSGAAEELSTAHAYQRKAGRRAACLMIVLVIVICVVLLAVLS